MSDRTLITWLYSPASRRDRILKAIDFAPDAVIYDLEDGVAPPQKAQARENLAAMLSTLDPADDRIPYLEVRVNQPGSEHFAEDLAMVRELPAVRSVRVPKVDGLDDLEEVASLLRPGMRVHALIETALGVENLTAICGSPLVIGASLGEADLRAALRISGTDVINHIRSRLVIASAAGGKNPPMGSAFLNINDHDGLAADTRRLAAQGFLGRTAIHPGQLPHIRAAFRPSQEEYNAARRILESVGGSANGSASGASALADGTFIDRPVIVRARQTIDLWDATAPGGGSR